MLKDLDSKWEPSDRRGKWLKLKPDYVHSESDLDALIIGEHMVTLYGSLYAFAGISEAHQR